VAYQPFWAKNAKVRINGATFAARTWAVNTTVEVLDGMSMEDAGFEHPVAGVLSLEATITSFTDNASNPYASPPNLNAGATLTNVRLYQNDTTSGYWDIPTAIVTASSQTADVRQLMSGSVTIRGVGTWTPPA
jgi:hypothetical protein